MNFTPLGKRVLIEREEETNKTASGIIIPDNAKEKPFHGTVKAVSAEITDVKVGDHVVFGKFSGSELTIEAKTYVVMDVEDIFGIMK